MVSPRGGGGDRRGGGSAGAAGAAGAAPFIPRRDDEWWNEGDRRDEAARLAWTLRHSVSAMAATSLTTAAAFMSNLASSIAPVQLFGVFMARKPRLITALSRVATMTLWSTHFNAQKCDSHDSCIVHI